MIRKFTKIQFPHIAFYGVFSVCKVSHQHFGNSKDGKDRTNQPSTSEFASSNITDEKGGNVRPKQIIQGADQKISSVSKNTVQPTNPKIADLLTEKITMNKDPAIQKSILEKFIQMQQAKDEKLIQIQQAQLQLQKEKAKQDRKIQEQRKEQRRKQNRIKIRLTVATMVVMGLAGATYQFWNFIQNSLKEKSFRERYSCWKLERNKKYGPYKPGTSIEKKLKSIMQETPSQIQIIFGLAGSGKTDAFTYLVNKMREQGKEVIYINLRRQGKQGNIDQEQVRKAIIDLKRLMSIVRKRAEKKQGIIFIIDDINMLQVLNNRTPQGKISNFVQEEKILRNIASMPHDKVNVILMSSSSSFVNRYNSVSKDANFLTKESRFEMIQPLTRAERKSILSQSQFTIKGEKKMIPIKILQEISQERSMRQSFECLNIWFKNLKHQSILSEEDKLKHWKSFIQRLAQKRKNELNRLKDSGEISANQKIVKQFFKRSLKEYGKQFSDMTLYEISNNIRELNKDLPQEERNKIMKEYIQFTNLLDEKNIIMLGQPRSMIDKLAFLKYLESRTTKTKPTVTNPNGKQSNGDQNNRDLSNLEIGNRSKMI